MLMANALQLQSLKCNHSKRDARKRCSKNTVRIIVGDKIENRILVCKFYLVTKRFQSAVYMTDNVYVLAKRS